MCVQQGEKQQARNALQAPWGVVVSNSWEPFLVLCYLLTSLGKRNPCCILFWHLWEEIVSHIRW